jgi:hypothetical protein
MFTPGEGYIVTASHSFSETFLNQERISIRSQYPAIQPSDIVQDSNLTTSDEDCVRIKIRGSVIINAISQLAEHPDVTALKQTEVDAYRASDSAVNTFYAARGLEITFNTMMALDDTYSSDSVYNRTDFQSIYFGKYHKLEMYNISYAVALKNAKNEVRGGAVNRVPTIKYDANKMYEFRVKDIFTANNTYSKFITITLTYYKTSDSSTITSKFFITSVSYNGETTKYKSPGEDAYYEISFERGKVATIRSLKLYTP